jgi:hypothetical protein
MFHNAVVVFFKLTRSYNPHSGFMFWYIIYGVWIPCGYRSVQPDASFRDFRQRAVQYRLEGSPKWPIEVLFTTKSDGVYKRSRLWVEIPFKNGMIQVVRMHSKIQSLFVRLEQMTESVFDAFSMWKTGKTALSWIEFCRLLPRTSGIRIKLTIPHLLLSLCRLFVRLWKHEHGC